MLRDPRKFRHLTTATKPGYEEPLMPTIQQEHCKKCGGIKKMTVNGVVVPVLDWPKYGVAADANCVC